MNKRAVLIITDGLYVDGVTLRTGDDHTENPDDVVEHLSLRTSEQLLADLRRVLARAVQRVDSLDPYYTVIDCEAIARVRAAIGDGHE